MFSIFCTDPFDTPDNGTSSSHTLCPGRPSPLTSYLPMTASKFWLIVVLHPQKAATKSQRPANLSIFCASCSNALNKGTNNGDSKPNAVHLLRTHRELQSLELGPWQMLP